MGQLVMVLRAKFLVDAHGYNKIQGKPFKTLRDRAEDRRNIGLKSAVRARVRPGLGERMQRK